MIESTKPNIDFAKRLYQRILITTSYTMISTWNNATGWTLTIPFTGRFKIKASGVIIATESSTASNIVAYCRLAKGGTPITGTARSVGISINAATYAMNRAPFELTWEDDFTAGEVITLQAAHLVGSGNECVIHYVASSIEPFFSYEQVLAYVPAIDSGNVYSALELDTGKTWIDGKRIYRKVINFGAPPNTTSKAVAHGITGLDKIIPGSIGAIGDNGTNQIPFPRSSITDNECVDLYIDNTNINMNTWSATYTAYLTYVTLEYTKG